MIKIILISSIVGFIASLLMGLVIKKFFSVNKLYITPSEDWVPICIPIPEIPKDTDRNFKIFVTDGENIDTLSKYSTVNYNKFGEPVLEFTNSKITHWKFGPGLPKKDK